MKKKLKWPFAVLCIILAYALGAFVFISVTTLPHVALALDAQSDYAVNMAEAVAADSFDTDSVGKNRKVMIYSQDGKIISEHDPFVSIDYSCQHETDKFFASGAAEAVSKPMYVIESNKGSFADRVDIIIYAAQPIVRDGKPHGALVLIADLVSDVFFVQNSFLGFNCVFFSFLICGVFILRKQRVMARQKQNYIDNITHELKTPIASIKALTAALNDHEMDPDTRSEYYGLILAEASRQEHMVQNILELSRIQSRDISLKKSAIGAEELFAPVCIRYSSLCDDLDISWKSPDNLKELPLLHTNADCIHRILDALLGNALRYTDENGLIEMSIAEEGRHITVCISDNGSGIGAEDLPHVFERFFRGSNSYVKGGNGLGLAIAKEIADGLGEKIWAERDLAQGSKFYFTVSK